MKGGSTKLPDGSYRDKFGWIYTPGKGWTQGGGEIQGDGGDDGNDRGSTYDQVIQAEAVEVIGQVTDTSLSLYAIHHPMLTTFGEIAFRPQLQIDGSPHFTHSSDLPADLIRQDEEVRPQVVAVRAWGAQVDGGWDYTEAPDQSRARGGIVAGGILYTPPGLEMEDYLGISDGDTDSPGSQGYVAAAPGVAFALGQPNTDGGLAAKSVVIEQDETDSNHPLTISQLNSSRVAANVFVAELDQGTGEMVADVATGGNQAMRIPRGTTAQRPSALAPSGGEIRISTDAVAGVDTLEIYDAQGAAWVSPVSTAPADMDMGGFDINDVGQLGVGTATPGQLIDATASSSGATVGIRVENTSGTANSSARFIAKVASGGEDAYIRFLEDSGESVCAGLDSSAAQYQVTDASAMGTQVAFAIDLGANNDALLSHTLAVGSSSTTAAAQLYVNQNSSIGAIPVLELDQDDADVEFIEFDGTSGTGGANSLDSSTGESGACGGKIRVTINGATKWLRFYDDET